MDIDSGFVLAQRAAEWENAASRRREGGRVRTAMSPRWTRAVNPDLDAHPDVRSKTWVKVR